MTSPVTERGLRLPPTSALAVLASSPTGADLLTRTGFDQVETLTDLSLSPELEPDTRDRLLEFGVLAGRATDGLAATAGASTGTTLMALLTPEAVLLSIFAGESATLLPATREETSALLVAFLRTADEGGQSWALARYAGEHALTLSRTGADHVVAADNPADVPTSIEDALARLLAF